MYHWLILQRSMNLEHVMTFEIDKKPTDEQVLFGDEDLLRGVTIDKDYINIYGGTQDLKLKYGWGWNVIGVFWKNVGDYQGLYFTTDDKGTFETKKYDLAKAPPILVGKKFQGIIGAFDIVESLHKYWNIDPDERLPVPPQLMDILLYGHYMFPEPI